MPSFPLRPMLVGLALALLAASPRAGAEDDGWIRLFDGKDLQAWKTPTGQWQVVGEVAPDSENPKLLASKPGQGVLVNGPKGRTGNLLSKESFGDVEFHCEFLVPKGSNSGVKFEGLYEVQIADSWGKAVATASDCGGLYPRAELLPKYHYLDKGFPPRTNASKPPGEWQTLDVIFHAPRFGPDGKKVDDARFAKVVLNGQVIHQDQALASPTGHAWKLKEVPTGPILLQADHGPVAFRDVRVRRLPAESEGQSR
jgi:hypothetical protein